MTPGLRLALQSNQSSLCSLYRSRDQGVEGTDGQVVSVKRAADNDEKKVQGQQRILAEQLDKLEKSNFCDFEKPGTSTHHKRKIESNEQSDELLPSTRWESLSTLLLPSGLSLSPPAYQRFLNASFYPVFSSFWNLIPSLSLPARPVSALDGLHLIEFYIFLSPFWMGLTNPGRALGRFCLLIDFSKAFDSAWLFHKLISAGLPPCFARWTHSFLSDRCAWRSFKITFRVRRGAPQGFVLGPVLFSLFINDLPAFLPSFVSCSLYDDDLTIWSSSPSVPTAVEATQGALFRLERWSEYLCLPLNPSKCEASFFSMDLHQANLQPLLLFNTPFGFNFIPS